MGLISRIAGYFIGIIIVLVGLLWITSTMTISVVLIGLIGLLMVMGGFGIMYLGHRSGSNKKHEILQ